MIDTKTIKQVENLITQGKVFQAIQLLIDDTRNIDIHSYRKLLNLASQFKQINNDENLGLNKDSEGKNRITNAVIDLITSIRQKNQPLTENHNPSSFNTSLKLHKRLLQSGIQNIHPSMSYDLFNEKIISSKKQIIILQTWLNALSPISEPMIEAANRGVDVKILILDPSSNIAKQRSVELGLEWNTSRPKALFEGIEMIFKKNNLCNKIFVKLHERIPPFSMYLVDEWMMIGFYWHGRGSVSNQMMEFQGIEKGKMGWLFLSTFKEIWNDKKSTQEVDFDVV